MNDKTNKLKKAAKNNIYLLNNKTFINPTLDQYPLSMSRVEKADGIKFQSKVGSTDAPIQKKL